MQTIELTANKVSCGHCKMAVESAAGELDGVESVTADPDTKKIELTYDEKRVSVEDISKAIEAAGYPID